MLKRFILLAPVLIIGALIIPAACAPNAAAPGAGTELSFTPVTYTSEQYGFSIQYPDTYKENKSREKGTMIFNAVGPLANNRIPVLTINIFDAGKAQEQGTELLKAASGTEIKITPVKEITLADGKTKGQISTQAWYNNDAKFDMRGLTLGVVRGDYQITVTITSIFAMYNEDKYMEILNTFRLNSQGGK